MLKLNRIVKLVFCIGMFVALMGCAATQKHESSGQYVDDSVITTKVKTAILEEPTLKMFQINVKTYNAVVQLSGFVNSAESVAKAGDVARRVEGVKELKNDLIIK